MTSLQSILMAPSVPRSISSDEVPLDRGWREALTNGRPTRGADSGHPFRLPANAIGLPSPEGSQNRSRDRGYLDLRTYAGAFVHLMSAAAIELWELRPPAQQPTG